MFEAPSATSSLLASVSYLGHLIRFDLISHRIFRETRPHPHVLEQCARPRAPTARDQQKTHAPHSVTAAAKLKQPQRRHIGIAAANTTSACARGATHAPAPHPECLRDRDALNEPDHRDDERGRKHVQELCKGDFILFGLI